MKLGHRFVAGEMAAFENEEERGRRRHGGGARGAGGPFRGSPAVDRQSSVQALGHVTEGLGPSVYLCSIVTTEAQRPIRPTLRLFLGAKYALGRESKATMGRMF